MNGSIRQRYKGTWQIRYSPPADGSGRRKFLTETVRGTKKEAQAVLRDRITALETGNYVEKARETVAGFMNRWFEIYAVPNTDAKTQQGYRGIIRRYINPVLGNIKVQSLTARQVQALYVDMLSRGIGAPSVVSVHRVIREALGHALNWGIVTKNVAVATKPPRIERKTMEMWDIPDIHRFLDAAFDDSFYPVYQLAVLTGLRRGEVFGLKWDAVDLEGSTLRVTRTLQRISGCGLVEGQPKTPRSRRNIDLAPGALALLDDVRAAQVENRLEYGDLWQDTGHVFTHLNGSPIDPDYISKRFAKLVRASGLPHLTFHGLRHAHATLAFAAGVSPKTISERLGHASIAITMDIYAHVLPGMGADAALAVERLLARP